jgi:glycosyltransferase involved in cell wall biosynthesis
LPDAAGLAPLPPFVAFANDWATDPTSKHHLMRLLAERTDVLWVEASGMRRPSITSGADWQRILRKVRKIFGGTRPGAPGLTVLSPPALPFPTSAAARAVNARLYRSAVRRALRPLGGGRDPILWVCIPTVARYLDLLPGRGLVYHCVDRWWAFSDYDTDEMLRCHEILCRRADRVFATSRELEQDCLKFTDRVSYTPHGVDWDHFHQAVAAVTTRPADLPDTGRPVAGFVGLIDDWIDLDLLVGVARANPGADVLVIGASRVPMDALAALPNVRLVGRKPFAELPAYLARCDVALIPFKVNDLTLAVNPIKYREYLSAGVPVVTTALPEMVEFEGREGTDVVRDAGAFVAAVTRRLAAPVDAATRARLSESMRSESWPGRLDQMLGYLEHLR